MNNDNRFHFYMLTIFLCGSLLFLHGFFPVSYEHVGNNGPSSMYRNEKPKSLDGFSFTPTTVQFSRVILMIIDSLRLDFANLSTMPFATASSCKLKMKVNVPTVTMPRIKSLITGKISNFIDIVLNLGNTEHLDDSILNRLRNHGYDIVFAGDNTWLNLFPNIFKRKFANTDSFYVQDFYKGDKNITKILTSELKAYDWNMLILHYLGLDHIGHVEGSASPKIRIKLTEMDDVIRQIQSSNEKLSKPSLLLVTGDHGMRNGGGHGGSTPEELNVPLLSFIRNCSLNKPDELRQIDLAPTLSILFATEIPSTSIGCLIPELINSMSLEDQLYSYYYNSKHLAEKAMKFGKDDLILDEYHRWYASAKETHKLYLKTKQKDGTESPYLFEESKLNYIRFSREVSKSLMESLVRFDNDLVAVGVMLTTLAAIFTIVRVLFLDLSSEWHLFQSFKHTPLILISSVCINAFCHYVQYINTNNFYNSCLFTLPIALCIYLLSQLMQLSFSTRRLRLAIALPFPLLFCSIFHVASLFSSSFVEEEHQTWYYLGPSFIIVLFVQSTVNVLRACCKSYVDARRLWLLFSQFKSMFPMMLIIALARKLNQTGDKWRNLPDYSDFLYLEENKLWMSAFLIGSLILLLIQLRKFNSPSQMGACVVATLAIYCFRGITGIVIFFETKHFNSFFVIPLFWICILYILAVSYKSVIKPKKTFYQPKPKINQLLMTNITTFALLSALLHKPHNVILICAMKYILQKGFQLCDILRLGNVTEQRRHTYILLHKTALAIFVAKMFFFYQGNSNSLATIDLNPGYIGMSSYSPVIVTCMLTLNTYFAQIFGFLLLILNVFEKQVESLPLRQEKEEYLNEFIIETSERDLKLALALSTAITLFPISVYFYILITFRHHLFIYTVFAPKILYECVSLVVFYLSFIMTNLYFCFFK